MTLVRAKFLQNDCEACLNMLLEESKSCGGFPLEGVIVEIPERWLKSDCPHGRSGLKFVGAFDSGEGLRGLKETSIMSSNIGLDTYDPTLDATKNIGYFARERGRYGSHPMHDDYDDDSDPDGSGTY